MVARTDSSFLDAHEPTKNDYVFGGDLPGNKEQRLSQEIKLRLHDQGTIIIHELGKTNWCDTPKVFSLIRCKKEIVRRRLSDQFKPWKHIHKVAKLQQDSLV